MRDTVDIYKEFVLYHDKICRGGDGMRRQIKEVVYANKGDFVELPENLDEFLRWWTDKVDMIPQEYRAEAKVECTSGIFYECSHLEIEIYYNRPETDEEIRLRLHQESLNLEAIRRQELQKLAELKAKYEAE